MQCGGETAETPQLGLASKSGNLLIREETTSYGLGSAGGACGAAACGGTAARFSIPGGIPAAKLPSMAWNCWWLSAVAAANPAANCEAAELA